MSRESAKSARATEAASEAALSDAKRDETSTWERLGEAKQKVPFSFLHLRGCAIRHGARRERMRRNDKGRQESSLIHIYSLTDWFESGKGEDQKTYCCNIRHISLIKHI